ncbi:DNA-binding protein WhiA [Schaedlerella sp.]|uniref:DNA-binding protein WhiA n=1 Tax=Schaedlerella sp. TaxID=2676057 RepID=UPI003744D160
MSFSGNVKEELSRSLSPARHCQIAELAALLSICGSISIDSGNRYRLKIHTENQAVARKVFTLIEKTFNIDADISIRKNMTKKSVVYAVIVRHHVDALRILQAAKLIDEPKRAFDEVRVANPIVVQQTCCRRAFIRGAFLAAGSMSDPAKSYHFEIVCGAEAMAVQIQKLICSFSMDAKIVPRKKSYVVYLKEGSQIVDILNVMEAHVSLMELDNVRILKEMRNTVKRKENCETANINKTVSAAVRQMENITYLRDTIGFEKLPEGLEEVALARLSHPDASLKELGEILSPPVGKSGVNHRLRKLEELAEKVKQEQGGSGL